MIGRIGVCILLVVMLGGEMLYAVHSLLFVFDMDPLLLYRILVHLVIIFVRLMHDAHI